ncbi:hypothetical protein CONCODRAFT_9802 [Conidiobolus coronatus NRRL 28638]|uniref:Uncharacterized protein n=1 Tax=Conidiobolus coronatus (strain ATCC 28846 / CBS 209.66 / NRRL 28638) TaxID=796925 RepID=A0A137NZI3_CONC2|nr:hypothetical protein CONCODRAFT_9802 [Conidiobolus coronatus NRRL 28638]|eukprot:KXN68071.1 hypothetical protein CONCODRAFT_9802 [Conidiobolus coronatus NRRL 28638]
MTIYEMHSRGYTLLIRITALDKASALQLERIAIKSLDQPVTEMDKTSVKASDIRLSPSCWGIATPLKSLKSYVVGGPEWGTKERNGLYLRNIIDVPHDWTLYRYGIDKENGHHALSICPSKVNTFNCLTIDVVIRREVDDLTNYKERNIQIEAKFSHSRDKTISYYNKEGIIKLSGENGTELKGKTPQSIVDAIDEVLRKSYGKSVNYWVYGGGKKGKNCVDFALEMEAKLLTIA